MGRSDLPDMYAWVQGCTVPKDEVDISGRFRPQSPHMVHMLCNTPSTLKICENLPFTVHVVPLYIMMDAICVYGF